MTCFLPLLTSLFFFDSMLKCFLWVWCHTELQCDLLHFVPCSHLRRSSRCLMFSLDVSFVVPRMAVMASVCALLSCTRWVLDGIVDPDHRQWRWVPHTDTSGTDDVARCISSHGFQHGHFFSAPEFCWFDLRLWMLKQSQMPCKQPVEADPVVSETVLVFCDCSSEGDCYCCLMCKGVMQGLHLVWLRIR